MEYNGQYPPRVLTACPTCEDKRYALGDYLRAHRAFSYPSDLLMVDNSPDLAYCRYLNDRGIWALHCEGHTTGERLMNAWRVIARHSSRYELVFSCEADNINPPETIAYLLWLMRITESDIVAHNYPVREAPERTMISLGCTLLRSELVRTIFRQAPPDYQPEGAVYEYCYEHHVHMLQVYNILETQHLAAP